MVNRNTFVVRDMFIYTNNIIGVANWYSQLINLTSLPSFHSLWRNVIYLKISFNFKIE